ncbi:arsenate reductase/protein-tyrosine-phosphatase family protein [Microbacterium mcarthurae (nom. nud.)]|uniref:Low molecular weight phosphatase family protein n=1 Tax=Microbacterium mcarthurae TaxID=3035918 RepID=A0ABW9GI28_9MICO
MTFTVLAVCTGNVCRSPVAELQIAAALQSIAAVRVSSAGTHALVGSSVPETTLLMSREYGLDASQHRARQLTDELIRDADLIIAMAREHRRAVVEAVPAAVRRTFTLRELARIAAAAKDHPMEELTPQGGDLASTDALAVAVTHAAALRGRVGPVFDQRELDVEDPFGRSEETYRRSFEELIPAGAAVAAYLLAANAAA